MPTSQPSLGGHALLRLADHDIPRKQLAARREDDLVLSIGALDRETVVFVRPLPVGFTDPGAPGCLH